MISNNVIDGDWSHWDSDGIYVSTTIVTNYKTGEVYTRFVVTQGGGTSWSEFEFKNNVKFEKLNSYNGK